MHFATLVITPDKPDQDAIDGLLRPFCFDNEASTLPSFDYCKIGGRFVLELRPGARGQPAGTAQLQKRDLDVAGIETRAVAAKATQYDRVHAALGGRPLPDLAALVSKYGAENGGRRFQADAAVVAAFRAAPDLHGNPASLIALSASREDVLAMARHCAILSETLVIEGAWHAFDGFEYDDDPIETARWADLFHSLLAGAASADWLTIVDCHR